MKLDVIVCTRNRAGLLRALLCSIVEAGRHAVAGWQLLLVDNGSTDATPGVVVEAARYLPITAFREDAVGLSNARNAGWKASKADICLFVDDDCRVPSTWLKSWQDGIRRWPEAGFYGAPLVAEFWPRRPRWADPENYGFLFCHFNPQESEGPTDVLPCGGNMAIRRSLLEELNGFDPALGLSGDRMIGGEETAFFREAASRGRVGAFLPGAWTYHTNPSRRLTLGYAWRRSVGQGRTMAIWAYGNQNPPPPAISTTFRRFRKNIDGGLRTLLRRPSWKAFGRLWVQLGLARGHWGQLRIRKRPA